MIAVIVDGSDCGQQRCAALFEQHRMAPVLDFELKDIVEMVVSRNIMYEDEMRMSDAPY